MLVEILYPCGCWLSFCDRHFNILQPNYVPTLEDKVEAERQLKVEELKKNGEGTKVTPETFAAWQENKRKMRAEEAKKLVEIELRKKKGGKGLAVLSGRALYEYKQDLFNVEDNEKEGDTDVMTNDKANGSQNNDEAVEIVASNIQTNLFLEGDDDLDDLDGLDED